MSDKDQHIIFEKYLKEMNALDMLGLEPEDFGHEDPDQAAMDRMDREEGGEDWKDGSSNKFRGPGAPGVNLARGFVLQALDLIDDDGTHLCADGVSLAKTIECLQKAIDALSHDQEEVPNID